MVIEVAIGPGHGPETFRVEIVASPVGATETISLDTEAWLARRGDLQRAVLASAVSTRRVLSETEDLVRGIGQALFTALLGTGEVAGQYRAATREAAKRGE